MLYHSSISGRGPRPRLVYAHSWKSRQHQPKVKKSATGLLRGLSILFFDDEASSTNLKFW